MTTTAPKTTLRPGYIYRVARPVDNPALDRRSKSDAEHLAWTVGDEFVTHAFDLDRSLSALKLAASTGQAYGSVHARHPGYDALVAACEPVESAAFRKAKRLVGELRAVAKDLEGEERDRIASLTATLATLLSIVE